MHADTCNHCSTHCGRGMPHACSARQLRQLRGQTTQRPHLASSLSSSRASACSKADSLMAAAGGPVKGAAVPAGAAIVAGARPSDATKHAGLSVGAGPNMEAATAHAGLSVRCPLTVAAAGPAQGAAVPAGAASATASRPPDVEACRRSTEEGCLEVATVHAGLSVRCPLTCGAGPAFSFFLSWPRFRGKDTGMPQRCSSSNSASATSCEEPGRLLAMPLGRALLPEEALGCLSPRSTILLASARCDASKTVDKDSVWPCGC